MSHYRISTITYTFKQIMFRNQELGWNKGDGGTEGDLKKS